MSRIAPLLLLAAVVAQPAQAAVTYTWQQVAPSASMPDGLNLELRFSEQALAAGQLSLDIRNECDIGPPCIDQQDSLLSLRYWFDDPVHDARHNLIDYAYRAEPRHYYDRIILNVSFLDGGLLSGDIFASDGNSDFRMASNGALFTMQRANSDEFLGCGFAYPNCAGATGLLQADPPAAEVPEPATGAMLGLGLFAAWFARRRKR